MFRPQNRLHRFQPGNFMNIWNIRKVREENVLAGLLNTYEKKDLENFVTDFTKGFFRGKG